MVLDEGALLGDVPQEIHEILVVKGIAGRKGLGRVLVDPHIHELGISRERQRREIRPLLLQRAAQVPQLADGVLLAPVFGLVVGPRAVAYDLVKQYQHAPSLGAHGQGTLYHRRGQEFSVEFAADAHHLRVRVLSGQRQPDDVLRPHVPADIVEVGEVVAAGAPGGDFLEIINHERRRGVVGREALLELAVGHQVLEILRVVGQLRALARGRRVHDLDIRLPGADLLAIVLIHLDEAEHHVHGGLRAVPHPFHVGLPEILEIAFFEEARQVLQLRALARGLGIRQSLTQFRDHGAEGRPRHAGRGDGQGLGLKFSVRAARDSAKKADVQPRLDGLLHLRPRDPGVVRVSAAAFQAGPVLGFGDLQHLISGIGQERDRLPAVLVGRVGGISLEKPGGLRCGNLAQDVLLVGRRIGPELILEFRGIVQVFVEGPRTEQVPGLLEVPVGQGLLQDLPDQKPVAVILEIKDILSRASRGDDMGGESALVEG